VQVQRHLAPGLPLAFGDRVHLQQVLLNLIVNGMDAMNDTPETARQLTVETRHDGDGMIEVAVTDQGHGLAPLEMSRIFDSFFTTRKDGMGLGLAIARSIIEVHQGRIWGENKPRGGATFRFTLCTAAKPTGQTPVQRG
jgi:two-component system, LuxR family, sensor kinase FixL